MNDGLTQPRRPRLRRLAVIGAVLAASVGVVAFGASIASGGQPSPGGLAIPLVSSAKPAPAPHAGGFHGDHGWAGPGGRMGFRGAMGAITIESINGSQMSLKTADGWTRTIDSSGATVTRAGQTIPISDLRVGDRIVFRETRESNGTYRIDSIRVVLPEVHGIVTSVGTSSVTVKEFDGTSKTVSLTSSTTYHLAGRAATKEALVAGVRVDIQGTSRNGAFTATDVSIAPSVVGGTVTAKGSDTITVKDRAGTLVTVHVTSSTTFQVFGISNPTFGDVAVGDAVSAQGTMNGDGSLTATIVRAGAAGTFGPGGPGGFGPMMGGHEMRGWDAPGARGAPANPGGRPAINGGSSTSGTTGA